MNKQGYPEEVTIVGEKDMCRYRYQLKNGKCCLVGWINYNFPSIEKDPYETKDISLEVRTEANKKSRQILYNLIKKIHNSNCWSIEDFNDEKSKRLNLDFLARIFNTMLNRIGYSVPKKYQLTKKELCPKSKK